MAGGHALISAMKPPEDNERIMIDSMPGMAWRCRPDGLVEFVNRRWLEYTGLSLDQSLGQGWWVAIHPDDLDHVIDRWRRLIASAQPGEMEARLRSGSGEYRWFLIPVAPSRNDHGDIMKRYGIATDVNELKRTDPPPLTKKMFEEVRVPEANLRRIIDTIPAIAWCNLPDGSNEFLNKRWHDYTGLSSEESGGFGWQTVIHPQDLPRMMKKWQEVLASGEAGEVEARLRRHDGSIRWFLLRAEPLRDETGKIVRWYGFGPILEQTLI
jgi:PAS domain S-box-containing protein